MAEVLEMHDCKEAGGRTTQETKSRSTFQVKAMYGLHQSTLSRLASTKQKESIQWSLSHIHMLCDTWGSCPMKSYNVIGIDLAKNVLPVCKVSKHGELTVNKAISPRQLKELLATSPPSIVAMAP